MKENPKRRKFRTFFISKDLQRPIVVAHLAYTLLVTVALIATVLSPIYTDMLGSDDLWTKHFSAKMFIVLIERLSIAGLIIMAISFFHFVILTHKFSGPLLNIGRTIARISEGDFTRKINLRRGDFLKNEAEQVNAMMTTLSNSIAIVKKENYMLLMELEESSKAFGEQTEIDTKLKCFQDRAHRCQAQLDGFQLIDDSMDNVGSGQRQQFVGDNPLSANTDFHEKLTEKN
jgi:methyl-accepting chemotaxis protein